VAATAASRVTTTEPTNRAAATKAASVRQLLRAFLQKLRAYFLTRLGRPVAPFGQTLRGEVVLRAPVGRLINIMLIFRATHD